METTEDSKRKSWAVVRAERMGLTVGEMLEKIHKRDRGCVINSLESVTGEKATREELQKRLATIDELEKLKYQSGGMKVGRRDLSSIMRLYKEIANSDTPMGTALKDREIVHMAATAEEIVKYIDEGHDVIILEEFISDKGDGLRHAAHVGHKEQEGLFSRSDNGIEIKLDTGERNGIVLIKKRAPLIPHR